MLVLEFHLPLSVQSLGIGGLLFALQTFVVCCRMACIVGRFAAQAAKNLSLFLPLARRTF